MSILDDAKRLANAGPGLEIEELPPGNVMCAFCEMDLTATRHTNTCPWLIMPKIVAALEAAEMVSIAYEEARILYGDGGSQMSHAMQVLDDALDGEAP